MIVELNGLNGGMKTKVDTDSYCEKHRQTIILRHIYLEIRFHILVKIFL
jgi:hypothetical protein